MEENENLQSNPPDKMHFTVRSPILYLRGENDGVVPGHTLRSLVRHKRLMEVVTLPAPHLVLQVAPEEAARAIRSFVANCAKE